MFTKLFRLLLLLAVCQAALTTCASSKSREDQGPIAKLWHNMNSHYNGYFNANELMEESLLTLEEQHTDNYTQRLDMFPYLELDNPSIIEENLDVAIEKVAIVVKKHPFSNWVDDSYLLVGQAQLLKQDYESAEKTLRFMTTEFRPRPKRKKSRSKKAKGKEDEEEEDAFVSRRDVEEKKDPAAARRDRIRARKEAQKERKKLQKEREKENKAKAKERERQRKARIKARKKGIKLAPVVRDTTANDGLENEPEEEVEEDLGPVGMISIFGGRTGEGDKSEAFGKKSGSYVVKHRPAYQEGRLWLALTFIKRDAYERAQLILEELRNDRGTFSDIRRKALAVQAYNYLEQDRLDEALPFLEEAAAVAETRNERARFYYIAGQLYQELRQPGSAAKAFEEAIAARPSYELELGARLNLAQNDFLSGSGSSAEALKRLEKMAKEDKNIPYDSQIYFSAATVALRDGDQENGQKFLRLALDSPNAGANQRLESYNLLGELAYDKGDYRGAKLAYDTTLTVMARGDYRYNDVLSRRDRLGPAAQNLDDIDDRTERLRIGTMPEAERTKYAQDLFQSQRAAQAAINTGPAGDGQPAQPSSALTSNSDFFAYNTATMRRSRRDFERRWGDRPLTDNWRLGSRANPGDLFEENDPNAGFTAGNENAMATEEEIAAILRDIPTDEVAQQTLRIQLAQNYFDLGREYRDRIGDNEAALTAFKALEDNHPGSAFEAEAWYYQYLINTELGRTADAGVYADKLRAKYTNSKFERLANDPSYAGKLISQDKDVERDYEAAQAAFEAGNYAQAAKMAQQGEAKLDKDHPLKPRYALMLAMAKGSTEGKPAYISSLQQVVSQYPNTPEQTRAKEILRLLGASGARIPGQAGGGGGGFKESFNELHYVLIIFDKPDVDLNEAKISVAEYNNKYNKLDRIRITNVYLGSETKKPVLIMRRFKSGEAAMEFLTTAKEREQEFLNAGKYSYDMFAVSQSNYRELLKQRTDEAYREWYPEFYR